MPEIPRKDLIVLVADKNMQFAVKEILKRHNPLDIREITYTVIPFISRNDPGCYKEAHNFLRPFSSKYDHALVMFDHEGCGQEVRSVPDIEDEVKTRLSQSGWGNRSNVVVIKPELEVWVWGDSPEVINCLEWNDQNYNPRTWLEQQGLWPQNDQKPIDPKLALEKVLYKLRKPRSARLYGNLAKRLNFVRCSDPSFVHFREILKEWFGNTTDN
jgi:hypothetical protein